MTKLLVLEINEVNFDYLEYYADKGMLPTIQSLLQKHGYSKTISETRQGVLNPWVQWITAHTGMDYDKHGIRRLGDMEKKSYEQIWERVEKLGYSVGAFVAFNAKNNLKDPRFFLADPWSRTQRVLSRSGQWADDALKQITHDYANGRIAATSVLKLAGSVVRNLKLKHYKRLLSYTKGYLNKKWYRALVCDLLMFDIFSRAYKRSQPDFATVFINAAAHVQHHYMFSSEVYDGPLKNPEWYYKGEDPLAEVYQLYDHLLGEVLETIDDDTRVIVMTGLSQEAHDRLSIYYRLKDHADFLDQLKVPYSDIQPLMTEDFILRFNTPEEATIGQQILESVVTKEKHDIFFTTTADDDERKNTTSPAVFYVDNRGDGTLYIQLRPCGDKYPDNFTLYFANQGDEKADKTIENFEKQVDFVSIKNAGHNGTGYFIDTGCKKGELPAEFPLRAIPDHIAAIFGDKTGRYLGQQSDAKTAENDAVITSSVSPKSVA